MLVLGLLLSVVGEKAKGMELEVVESVLHRVGRFSLGLGESQFSHPSSSSSDFDTETGPAADRPLFNGIISLGELERSKSRSTRSETGLIVWLPTGLPPEALLLLLFSLREPV